MQPHNQSQKPEHIERIEDDTSSAGWQTQQLSMPAGIQPMTAPGASNSPVATNKQGWIPTARRSAPTNALALGLVAIGGLFWLTNLYPDADAVRAGMILLTIASPFLFLALWRRLYPLLLPGCILAGLSIGVPSAGLTNGISVLWGLAAGFTAIFLIGRSLFNIRSPWAMFPAVVLFGIGVLTGIASLPIFFAGGFIWLPLLLIAAGAYLGWGRRTP